MKEYFLKMLGNILQAFTVTAKSIQKRILQLFKNSCKIG